MYTKKRSRIERRLEMKRRKSGRKKTGRKKK